MLSSKKKQCFRVVVTGFGDDYCIAILSCSLSLHGSVRLGWTLNVRFQVPVHMLRREDVPQLHYAHVCGAIAAKLPPIRSLLLTESPPWVVIQMHVGSKQGKVDKT